MIVSKWKTNIKMKTHKDLEVYKEAMNFVTEIYKTTKNFPKEEVYGLTNQIRRAAVSIPSNIAEGASRNSKKEYLRFLYIAKGSNSELDTQLTIARNLEYLEESLYSSLKNKNQSIGKMLSGLIKYLGR